MAGNYYSNPYTVETPVGAGLQNIAASLFRGREMGAKEDARRERAGMDEAHAGYYRELGAKALAERRLAERLLRDQGRGAQDEVIAANAGVDMPTLKSYQSSVGGTSPVLVDSYGPAGARMSDATLAVRGGYADKTINPVNIADTLSKLKALRDRNEMIAGTMKPETAGPAYAATEGKPLFHIGETGSGNLFTGAQTLNDLGAARSSRERATAFRDTQHGRTYQNEADTGVRLGPPVLIDSEAGPVYSSGRGAVGQRPGIDPTKLAVARNGRGGADAGSTTVTDLKPLKIDKGAGDLLLGGIDRAVGGRVDDKILEGAILARAQQYYATPGSPHYGQHEAAARAATTDVVPEGFDSRWFGGMKAKGEPQTNLGPVEASGATTTTKRVTKGAPAPAAAATAVPAAPKATSRPAGKSDQQLIDEANQAIKGGKNRQMIEERLRQWGVKTA